MSTCSYWVKVPVAVCGLTRTVVTVFRARSQRLLSGCSDSDRYRAPFAGEVMASDDRGRRRAHPGGEIARHRLGARGPHSGGEVADRCRRARVAHPGCEIAKDVSVTMAGSLAVCEVAVIGAVSKCRVVFFHRELARFG